MKKIGQKYQIVRTLGKGAFGKVFLTRYQNQQYAVKVIQKARLQKDQYLIPYIQGEIQCMMSIKSDYVMGLIQVIEDDKAKYMVCEYCNGGNLLQYQFKLPNKVIGIEKTFQIISQILKGLQELHHEQFLHRDLKPQNILIKNENDSQVFKIADFGFARKEDKNNGTILGTGKFMAPQIYKQQKYGYGVDMWAVGVIIFYMLNAEYPFNPPPGQQVRQIKNKCTPHFSYQASVKKTSRRLIQNCTPELQDFFKKVFQFQPQNRMNFHNIKQSKFISKYFQTNTKAFTSSMVLYKSQFKGKNASKIPQITGKLGLLKRTNSNQPTTQGYEKQLEQINFYLQKIKLISDLSQYIQSQNKYLSQELKATLKYSFLKLAIVQSRNLQNSLKHKKLPQDINKQLNWQYFLKSKQCIAFSANLTTLINNLQSKFGDCYNDCYSIRDKIKQKMPKFLASLTNTIQQKQFNEFKSAFRSSTTYANKYLKQMYKKQMDNNEQIARLRVRILFGHVMNKLFIKQLIEYNFQIYFQWINKSKLQDSIKQKKFKINFPEFKNWLVNDQINNLIKTINLIWQKYFGIKA